MIGGKMTRGLTVALTFRDIKLRQSSMMSTSVVSNSTAYNAITDDEWLHVGVLGWCIEIVCACMYMYVYVYVCIHVCMYVGKDHGHYEDSFNAFVLMGNNALLLTMIGLYTCSIAFYNFFVCICVCAVYMFMRCIVCALV